MLGPASRQYAVGGNGTASPLRVSSSRKQTDTLPPGLTTAHRLLPTAGSNLSEIATHGRDYSSSASSMASSSASSAADSAFFSMAFHFIVASAISVLKAPICSALI